MLYMVARFLQPVLSDPRHVAKVVWPLVEAEVVDGDSFGVFLGLASSICPVWASDREQLLFYQSIGLEISAKSTYLQVACTTRHLHHEVLDVEVSALHRILHIAAIGDQ